MQQSQEQLTHGGMQSSSNMPSYHIYTKYKQNKENNIQNQSYLSQGSLS